MLIHIFQILFIYFLMGLFQQKLSCVCRTQKRNFLICRCLQIFFIIIFFWSLLRKLLKELGWDQRDAEGVETWLVMTAWRYY